MPSRRRAAREKRSLSLDAGQRERAEGVRLAYRRGLRKMTRRELGVRGDAEQSQADADLVLEELERAHQARHARGGEPEAGEASEAHRLCAERDRLYDIGAAHEPA